MHRRVKIDIIRTSMRFRQFRSGGVSDVAINGQSESVETGGWDLRTACGEGEEGVDGFGGGEGGREDSDEGGASGDVG